jgi:hypothetical protein
MVDNINDGKQEITANLLAAIKPLKLIRPGTTRLIVARFLNDSLSAPTIGTTSVIDVHILKKIFHVYIQNSGWNTLGLKCT